MLKLFVRNKKKNNCNICFENKDCVQCLKCNNCNVCHDCLLSMCENGICDKCPHCRQEKWRKSNKSQIVPINTPNVLIRSEQKQATSNYVYRDENSTNALSAMTARGRIYYKVIMSGVMITLSWMCGFITVIICTGKKVDFIDVNLLTWIALLIGLVEVHCLTLCCFVNVCKHPIKNKDDYCNMFCTIQ